MRERIVDKIIIQSCWIIGMIFFVGNEIQVDMIIACLVSFILVILTDIIWKNSVAFCATVFSMLMILFTKVFVVVVPGIVYAVLTSPCVFPCMQDFLTYLQQRNHAMPDREKRQRISSKKERKQSAFALFLALGLMIESSVVVSLKNSRQIVAGIIIFSAIAIVFAYKWLMHTAMQLRLTENFDKARGDAGRARQERKATMQREEEHIYTATLQERNRIAREIHDNVGHMLTRAIVQMQAIKIINKHESTKPYLESVDETINQAMLNIRKSVHELHDDSIDLSIMINELIKSIPERFTVNCNTSIESAVSSELKNNILAIIKEAITNLVKYSNGNKVRVEVIEHAAFWRILVWDNGENPKREFELNAALREEDSGIGMINIWERSKKLGGRANISSDEKGFQVLVTIPK